MSLNTPTKIIRLPEVRSRTGLARSTLYAEVRAGRFPAPLKLTARTSGWDARAVDQWISARLTASDTQESRHEA
jgi:prophage regulatory protein